MQICSLPVRTVEVGWQVQEQFVICVCVAWSFSMKTLKQLEVKINALCILLLLQCCRWGIKHTGDQEQHFEGCATHPSQDHCIHICSIKSDNGSIAAKFIFLNNERSQSHPMYYLYLSLPISEQLNLITSIFLWDFTAKLTKFVRTISGSRILKSKIWKEVFSLLLIVPAVCKDCSQTGCTVCFCLHIWLLSHLRWLSQL